VSYESTAEPVVWKLDPQSVDGSGYLVARQLEDDGVNSRLVGRFGEE
jgi:hypothetical protein